ncbi:MAG: SIS domain-containing protein, partial [Anaerolineae bacterium]|nr:SIS domain-containing protein [Anaerolineae bacterium]
MAVAGGPLVRLFDLARRAPLATLRAHAAPVTIVCFSPDGARLATTGAEGEIIVWDMSPPNADREWGRLRGHGSRITALAWRAEGRVLASGDASAAQTAAVIGQLVNMRYGRDDEIESDTIKSLIISLDEGFVACVKAIFQCQGRLVVTGIGKSAIVAQKIVATLNSTGTPALFMHAADAIHGDLGMIHANDMV